MAFASAVTRTTRLPPGSSTSVTRSGGRCGSFSTSSGPATRSSTWERTSGVYTLLACSIPDVEVWAFEPSTSAFSRALENVQLNGLAGRVHLMRAAAGARDGYGHLTLGLDTVNRLDDVGGSGTEAVEVLALGPFLVRAGVDAVKVSVIKVDVEGSEPDVLAGARALLDVASPALIVERNERSSCGRCSPRKATRPSTTTR